MTNQASVPGLAEIGQTLLARLDASNQSRDRALNEGRQVVRMAANAIRALHRGELDSARATLEDAEAMLSALLDSLDDASGIRWAGYVQDAMKEYAEAHLALAFVTSESIPAPESLKIDDAPYLNALAESASELRRLTLDSLRAGRFPEAERLLAIMDEVYDYLVTVDYPDGLTGGLRRTTDALRAVLERTRGDLTLTGAQDRLHAALERTLAALESNRERDQPS
jgi:translin